MSVKFTIITLFQETLKPYLETSMMRKATENGIAEFNFVDLREFGLGPHKKVDDTPYGGGDGMLLRPEPIFNAIESVIKTINFTEEVPVTCVPTPAGETWNQDLAKKFAESISDPEKISDIIKTDLKIGDNSASKSGKILHFIIFCPHYEGFDERISSIMDYQFSLGRYILTGGELPALIFIDSIVRLLPGVLGGEMSAEIESFSDGDNIEYPQFTKPETFRDMTVPDILLSGNHGAVDKWREEQSKMRSQK